MKYLNKILTVALAAGLAFGATSCKDDDDAIAPWIQLTDANGVSFPSIVDVDFNGGQFTMNVYTNATWTVTADVDWLSADPAQRRGCTSGAIIVAPNEESVERSGIVRLIPDNPKLRTYTIQVNQEPAPENIMVYHVLPQLAGDGSGRSWNDAMGPAELEALLTGNIDLSAKEVALGDGEISISPGLIINKTIKLIRGNGADKTTLSLASHPTYGVAMMEIDNVSVTFEGIAINGGYSAGDFGYVRAFNVKGVSAQLNLNNCNVSNFNVAGAPDGAESQGAAIMMYAGGLRANGVTFSGNKGMTRGIIRGMGSKADGYIFLNNTAFIDNNVTGWWGICVHGSMPVAMNNTTIYGNYISGDGGRNFLINCDADLLLVNSTVYDAIPDGNKSLEGLIRYNTNDNIMIMNSLLVSDNENLPGVFQQSGRLQSGGYNVYMHMGVEGLIDAEIGQTATDTQVTSFSGSFINGLVQWTPSGITGFATLSDLNTFVSGFHSESQTALGTDFINWIGEDLGKDASGRSRNESRLQPGAYDPGL